MAELVLLVGLQAAGKTRFVQERLAATHLHLSKDHWPNARRREARLRRLLAEALARGRSVVVDNTSPTAADRAPLIAIARAHGARVVGLFFAQRLAGCLARNAERTGRARVSDEALCITAARLRPPTLAEGFDALYRVRWVEGGFTLV
ncbi:AAA family ATPase [Aggregicoccus sp. 17bor-14]|uniref:AAA family ATPase n=1 Tax=Myxococcaceae TaxID=31 RepID=UPI00129CA594|nr:MULTISPECIES: AAA family ATPase [Myxococcaceae]MBF5043489.1 AAA family ATPase [Simulacricoccus sp. 17bor-14]MRI89247.1 AAA family ATPase [Aggregicoccus sp. 17bor-14]